MEIKKYTARSVSQALQKIHADFGGDAVIISTQEMPGADENTPYRYEVIAAGTPKTGKAAAAARPQTAFTPLTPATAAAQASGAPKPRFAAPLQQPAEAIKPIIKPLPRREDAPAAAPVPPAPVCAPTSAQATPAALPHIAPQSEPIVGRLMEELTAVKSEILSLSTRFRSEDALRADPESRDQLLKNGVHPEVIDFALRQSGGSTGSLERTMAPLIPEPQPVVFSREAPRIMAFVGPTGVGKTTTLAKLAARYVLKENLSAALITIDTHRAGAADQLRLYSRLIGVPLEIATKPAELKLAIRKHLDKNLILIDTAGRSHHNKKQMSELREFLGEIPQLDLHLVVSASVDYDDLKDITQAYEGFGINNCIVTKMDETRKHGNLYNIAIVVEKPIPFVTDGQRVPEDLRRVGRADLLNLVFGRDALALAAV